MIHTSKQLKDKVRNISKGDNMVKKSSFSNGWEISPSFFYSYPKLSKILKHRKYVKNKQK